MLALDSRPIGLRSEVLFARVTQFSAHSVEYVKLSGHGTGVVLFPSNPIVKTTA